jgi:hypothetical protein
MPATVAVARQQVLPQWALLTSRFPMPDDPVLQALGELERVLDANEERNAHIRRRIAVLRERRAADHAWPAIVEEEPPPLVVQLVTRNIEALQEAGARVRREEARALHAGGLSMEAIARHFGVTRQRVSALLR